MQPEEETNMGRVEERSNLRCEVGRNITTQAMLKLDDKLIDGGLLTF